eukprot:GSMAST32.ASY1.ANO1.2729.1 assembled CDS
MKSVKQTIVIDAGSFSTKVGYSGEDQPHNDDTNSDKPRKKTLGKQKKRRINDVSARITLSRRNKMSLTYPIVNGEMSSKEGKRESIEQIWDWALYEAMDVDPEVDNLPVLLTDSCQNNNKNREYMCRIMFEKIKVNGFYVAPQPVLSLFSTGRTNGLAVEAGGGATTTLPVFEGYGLRYASQKNKVAGLEIDKHLQKMLSSRGRKFSRSQMSIVQKIKEATCAVSLHLQNELKDGGYGVDYELPDGEIIQIDPASRYTCTEALFNPEILGREFASEAGVAQLVQDSILGCDEDTRNTLYDAVVISGGSSMLPNYINRLQQDISYQNGIEIPTKVFSDSQRKYGAWIGGSMLASLSTFKNMKITKQEYDDVGQTIVRSKCF